MVNVTIKDTGLQMYTNQMQSLSYVDMLVIHHTGSETDLDMSAREINEMHINSNNWSGIGYHFVIRKNGDIEKGRPEYLMGAHVQGNNYHTLGIHICGEFHLGTAVPTTAQINSAARLVAYLCEKYGIPVDRNNIVGHRDVGSSDCPGDRLYALIPEIIRRAKDVLNGNPIDEIEFDQNDIDYLLSCGYTLQDAKEFLAKDPKYANGGKNNNDITESDLQGPNGIVFDLNDVQYLIKQGYTLQDAKEFLAKDPKYTIKKNENDISESDLQGPNGIVFELNDVQYLIKQGYTLQDAKEFLATADKYKPKSNTSTQQPSNTTSSSTGETEDWKAIVGLSAEYESGGDPGSVSSGAGDLGGVSYGLYQFASTNGSIDAFISWAKTYENPSLAQYAIDLEACGINTYAFQDKWEEIGRNDPEGFTELQDQYVISKYYYTAADMLARNYYHIERHTTAMKAVLFSRSIQYGPGNMVDLFETACDRMGHPNLSYVDSADYDKEMIRQIYTFLVEECDNAYMKGGIYHSPYDWANGSYTVVKVGLRNRFVNEMNKALEMI